MILNKQDLTLTPIIFGASGLLGGALFRHFKQQYPGTIGTYANHPSATLCEYKLNQSDLSNLPLCHSTSYCAIICSSLTNISFINAHPLDTAIINVTGSIRLITQLSTLKIPILFVSSDNVFAGTTGGYTDQSETTPVSEYGRQKLMVERALMEITAGQATIVRLSKIIGNSITDGTILNDIIRQLQSGDLVKAASDLRFNPTFIDDIVRAVDELVQSRSRGTFNFCNPQAVSRYELALLLADIFKTPRHQIAEIKFSELDPSGKRPLNTTMINSAYFQHFTFTSLEQCLALHRLLWN